MLTPLFANAYDPANCWSYVTERINRTIPAAVLLANATTTPTVGSVAVMRYEKQGLDHFAYVEAITDTLILISETNYKAGEFSYRFLPPDYPHLIGFADPKLIE